MKKLIGILVAVIMCAALCIPCAAADSATDPLAGISELLGGIDISALTEGELSALLGEFDLENIDIDALLEDAGSGIGDVALDLEENIGGALEGVEEGLAGRIKAVEDDYLKAADKEELCSENTRPVEIIHSDHREAASCFVYCALCKKRK